MIALLATALAGDCTDQGPGCRTHYVDLDRDGHGSTEESLCICPDAVLPPCPAGGVELDKRCWVPNTTDCDDLVEDIHPGAPEVVDGLDTDCDGRIAAIEFDCDNDGAFAYPVNTEFDLSELGLADCRGLRPPDLRCFDTAVPLTCDPNRGLWVVSTAHFADVRPDGEAVFSGPQRINQGTECWYDVPDCDDTCPQRCPAVAGEQCDGIDNDCNDAPPPADEDRDGLPDTMQRSPPGFVHETELDLDGDGRISCVLDPDEQQWLTAAGCRSVAHPASQDCNDLCGLAHSDVEQDRCNSFSVVEHCASNEHVELHDDDEDGFATCTASGHDIYVPVFARPEGKIVPLVDPRGGGADPELAAALKHLGIRTDGTTLPFLRTCIETWMCQQEDREEWWPGLYCRHGQTDPLPGGGAPGCDVVQVTLPQDRHRHDDGDPADSIRTVWPRERILAARQTAIEIECWRTFGRFGCSGREPSNFQSPFYGTPHPHGPRLPRIVTASMLDDAPDDFDRELHRFPVRPIGDVSIVGCWGSPVDDLGRFVPHSETVPGDCASQHDFEHSYEEANPDNHEGPGDVVAMFWNLDPDKACRTCRDFIDNDCDGAIDGDDASCDPCNCTCSFAGPPGWGSLFVAGLLGLSVRRRRGAAGPSRPRRAGSSRGTPAPSPAGTDRTAPPAPRPSSRPATAG